MKKAPTFQTDAWGFLFFGAAIGFLFSAIAKGVVSGLLILYAPMLLLCLLGFVSGGAALSNAIAGAALAIFFTLNPQSTLVFLLVMAVPIWLFIYLISPHQRGHHPTAHALGWLAFYGAASLLGLMFSPTAALPMHQFFVQELLLYYQSQGMQADELIRTKQLLIGAMPLVFASLIWVWVTLIYACVCLANFIAPVFVRPRLSLPPIAFAWPLPTMLVGVLALSCIIALVGPTPHIAGLGQSLSLVLMMPIFWLGMASVHQKLLAKQATKAVYFLVYLLTIIFLPFSPLIFLAFGLIIQLKASLPTSRS